MSDKQQLSIKGMLSAICVGRILSTEGLIKRTEQRCLPPLISAQQEIVLSTQNRKFNRLSLSIPP